MPHGLRLAHPRRIHAVLTMPSVCRCSRDSGRGRAERKRTERLFDVDLDLVSAARMRESRSRDARHFRLVFRRPPISVNTQQSELHRRRSKVVCGSPTFPTTANPPFRRVEKPSFEVALTTLAEVLPL